MHVKYRSGLFEVNYLPFVYLGSVEDFLTYFSGREFQLLQATTYGEEMSYSDISQHSLHCTFYKRKKHRNISDIVKNTE